MHRALLVIITHAWMKRKQLKDPWKPTPWTTDLIPFQEQLLLSELLNNFHCPHNEILPLEEYPKELQKEASWKKISDSQNELEPFLTAANLPSAGL